jgi:hypothetical protein
MKLHWNFSSPERPLTPVIYLYLDRLQNWLRGDARSDVRNRQNVQAAAAE